MGYSFPLTNIFQRGKYTTNRLRFGPMSHGSPLWGPWSTMEGRHLPQGPHLQSHRGGHAERSWRQIWGQRHWLRVVCSGQSWSGKLVYDWYNLCNYTFTVDIIYIYIIWYHISNPAHKWGTPHRWSFTLIGQSLMKVAVLVFSNLKVQTISSSTFKKPRVQHFNLQIG